VETQQVFGSSPAVSAYDWLNHALTVLASISAGFRKNRIHRVLDDLTFVDKAGSDTGYKLCASYTALCREISVHLAPLCPDNIKAFEAVVEGTVLGIRFHTQNLSWSLPTQKKDKIVTAVATALLGVPLSIENMQILMGLLNDLSQMLPFLGRCRHNLNKFLSDLLAKDDEYLVLPANASKDPKVWTLAACTAEVGLPIPHKHPSPSLAANTFVSDETGTRFAKINGRFIPYEDQDERGAASVSMLEDGPVWFWHGLCGPLPC
jgi:hypothetical protein